ncbi:FHA domain-containing protein [Nymphaea thermarum]|nr:FHA domain-containing protein [Nymphaea thermarum]
MSINWAHRLPPNRLMSSLPCEVSLGGERREQRATTLRAAEDGRKPKKRLAGLATSTYVRRAKCTQVSWTTQNLGIVQGLTLIENPWALLILLQWEERAEQVEKEQTLGSSGESKLQTTYIGFFKKQRSLELLTENMSAMDLVLGVHARDKHLQNIVLILGLEINQEPRMEVWTVGRNPNCDLVFQHPSIHGFHFELEVDKVSRRVWVTNLTLIGKLSVARIVIRPQCTQQFYPCKILKVGDSNRSFKLEVIPSVSGQEEGSHDSKHQEPYEENLEARAMQQLCEETIEAINGLQAKWKQAEIAWVQQLRMTPQP